MEVLLGMKPDLTALVQGRLSLTRVNLHHEVANIKIADEVGVSNGHAFELGDAYCVHAVLESALSKQNLNNDRLQFQPKEHVWVLSLLLSFDFCSLNFLNLCDSLLFCFALLFVGLLFLGRVWLAFGRSLAFCWGSRLAALGWCCRLSGAAVLCGQLERPLVLGFVAILHIVGVAFSDRLEVEQSLL